jgi:ribonuclease BN (tRNA processing enzyme)
VERNVSRRRFLTAGCITLSAALVPALTAAEEADRAKKRMRLILLGTKGGPRPGGDRHAPSQVIVVDDVPYVVDCGNGVAWQFAAARLRLDRLRYIFLTHQHSDHNADYGNLILLAWTAGLKTPVDSYGPPPLEKMTRLFFDMNAYDIRTRIADEGRPELAPLLRVHEIQEPGLVMEDERVRVTAALVQHPPVAPAFAYRFDGPDRSIVISGDTTYSEALVSLAKGADVLVHEALYLPGLEALLKRVSNATTLREHLLASHTTTEDVGRVAAKAGVKTLVLSHLVPGDDPSITDALWTAGVREHFKGEIIVGRDLLEV